MKKTFHHITLRLFVKEYEGDNIEDLQALLESIVPLDLEKEKLAVEINKATRHDNNTPIDILQIRLDKKRHIDAFFSHLSEKLDAAQKQDITEHLYVDEGCNFFLRLDKEELIDQNYIITTSGNCVHIRCLLAAYPSKQKIAEQLIKDYLKELF